MTLQSMTGFARASTHHEGSALGWEVKSVNGKGLDIRLRLPPGFERLEQPVRQTIQKRFARGSIHATLMVQQNQFGVQPIVNEAFLTDLAGLALRLTEQFGVEPARADGLLALRGVLEVPESVLDEEARTTLDAALLQCLGDALDGLEQARRAEGEALVPILSGQLDAIAALAKRARSDPSREPAAIRERLREQVALLLDTGSSLDDSRLHAEAAYLATKADIREELDRLEAHVASGHALLTTGGPIGRKLDFLAQEFNRESNTLCSKSNAAAITAIGLELKLVVDQFREQVQNLE